MDRRTFLASVPLTALAAACTTAGDHADPAALADWQSQRLGVTTVSFRRNFRPPLGPPSTVGPVMDMMTAPQIIRDETGLRNIELWSLMFQDQSLDYARSVRAAMDAAGCRVSNIQIDGRYDLSAADPAQRGASIETVKSWMDRAAVLGAPSVRANIDAGTAGAPLALELATQSFRELAAYGREKSVKILVENHIGASLNIDNCVSVLTAVNDPFCRGLLDWGNSSATNDAERITAFRKMFPYLDLVSAKGLHFDSIYMHRDYAIPPIVQATEASGYRGLYSIELYAESDGPEDPFAACRAMIAQIAPSLRR